MLANGATLGYKKKTGSPSTYTDLPGLKGSRGRKSRKLMPYRWTQNV